METKIRIYLHVLHYSDYDFLYPPLTGVVQPIVSNRRPALIVMNSEDRESGTYH